MKTLTETVPSPIGTPTTDIEMVCVDLPHVPVQRKVYHNKIDEYFKEVGTLDWRLFGVGDVVEYQCPELRGTREVVDMGHRIAMLKKYYPHIKQVPAIVHKVWDRAEASRLFHRFNGTCKKSVNNEEQFVAQVYGEEQYAGELADVLYECGLYVESNGMYATSSADPQTPDWTSIRPNKGYRSVKIAKFRALYKKYGYKHIKEACWINHSAFPAEANISPMLLEGQLKLREILGTLALDQEWEYGDMQDNFVDFLKLQAQLGKQTRLTYPELRKDNHYGISVAYGLFKDFHAYCVTNNLTVPRGLHTVKQMWEDAGKR